MRIAYFSPLNPIRSGIADYSEELLPYLAEHAEIELFVDDYAPSNTEIAKGFAIHSCRDFADMWRLGRFDVPLYHMGNHPCHEYIYRTLLQYPGVTVLHDYVLHHFIVGITVAKGDNASYIREMGYARGAEGAAAAREAIKIGHDFPSFRYPLNERVIDSSLGVLVHDKIVRNLVRTTHPQIPVARVPHGMDLDEQPRDGRRTLGLTEDAFLIGAFGLATPEKRMDVVLKAFKQILPSVPNAVLVIVGDVPPWNDVKGLVKELDLNDSVRITGFVDKQTLRDYIHASDICVNLRYPTCGETSGVALRCMAASKPLIVSNVGSFTSLPDGACIKVFIDEEEVERVAVSLKRLAEDKALREEMGLRAREYIRLEQDRAATAKGYIDLIREVVDGEA